MNQSMVSRDRVVEQDEIDLMELVAILWRGKDLVLVIVLLVLAVALAYAWWKPKLYKLEAQVSHPNSLELAELVLQTLEPNEDDLSASTKSLYSPKEVFVTAQRELVSRATQREFVLSINEHLVGGRQPLSFDWFAAALKVVAQKQGKVETGLFLVSLNCVDEEWCSGLINDYLDFVHNKVRDALVEDMVELLSSESIRVTDSMVYLRETHEQITKDRIVVLNAQIEIAKEMGWAIPKFEVLASDKQVPRYYEGYSLLEAERKQLERQSQSEPHIKGLREQQRRLDRIELDRERIVEVKNDVSVLNVVDYAYPTGNLVSPNKKLILVLAVMLGGFLGVMAVFTAHGVKAYRAKTEATSSGLVN